MKKNDFEKAQAATYGTYWRAMRKDISENAKAQLCLFADATGGWRGTAVTHVTSGSGDWAAGRALSKYSLDPLALGEGKDVNKILHLMLGKRCAPSFRRVAQRGTLTFVIVDDDGRERSKTVPSWCFFCADFQARCCVDSSRRLINRDE